MGSKGIRRAARLVLAVGVAAASLLVLHDGGYADDAATTPAVATVADRELAPADVVTVEKQNLRDRVVVSGELRPLSRAVIKAKVSGTIADVLVRPGQSVQQGDLLARFETNDLGAELRRKEATRAVAEAQSMLAEQTLTKARALQSSSAMSVSALEKAVSEAAAARANVAALEAEVETARTALANASVRAPISGIVATRSVDMGETVANGADLLTVVDGSAFEAEVLVATRDVPLLRIDQEAELSIDGLPDRKVTAKVRRISPVANAGTRFVPVFLHLSNFDGQLWGGMFASGAITVREKAGGIAVPDTAVRRDDAGKAYVLAIADGRLQRRDVGEGARWGRQIEIAEGLQPGDVLLKAPIAGLVAGTPVSVTAIR
ncbi:UNVERIFIED_ORG: efflux RND transporter periplasmic adaptor subunit (plasmid) [Roseateles sp. XES5]|nr:efflux RND transporter periplasmic adaptor subunit [Roseateles sp. XES5]